MPSNGSSDLPSGSERQGMTVAIAKVGTNAKKITLAHQLVEFKRSSAINP
jgi:hypothetical protein